MRLRADIKKYKAEECKTLESTSYLCVWVKNLALPSFLTQFEIREVLKDGVPNKRNRRLKNRGLQRLSANHPAFSSCDNLSSMLTLPNTDFMDRKLQIL